MRKWNWFYVGGGAALLGGLAILARRRKPWKLLARLPEPEEVDAYNTDDMQPPLEVQDPRQRPTKRWEKSGKL